MSYDDWKADAPDPGSVASDDRCPSCSARDGEMCDPDCNCGVCQDAADAQAMRRIEDGREGAA